MFVIKFIILWEKHSYFNLFLTLWKLSVAMFIKCNAPMSSFFNLWHFLLYSTFLWQFICNRALNQNADDLINYGHRIVLSIAIEEQGVSSICRKKYVCMFTSLRPNIYTPHNIQLVASYSHSFTLGCENKSQLLCQYFFCVFLKRRTVRN